MNVEDVVWYIVMNTNIDIHDVLRGDSLEKSTKDIMREIIDARDNAVERAGIVTISDIGDTSSNETQVSSIHKYKNNEKCECKCHPSKLECMECYDHPTHLSKKFTKKV
ncbi:MAG: hypothetical protein DRI84_06230 [Bacteroidetes bacterium]|jgi:hypothetical protein|nr:MAG: hypothetical protein DRI84_06230 [Bacteroidota bacterium]